jgi:adenylate kinase
MSNFIVLLGPPGAGKGTQAGLISESFDLPHISSGNIFRENMKEKTELGKLAEGYLQRGELVPDDLTISMIRERLLRADCAKGALLDGFPRTEAQAIALDEMLAGIGGKIVAVPYIKVAEDVLIDRLGGRWTCRESGHVFHEKHNPARQAGVCDFDGSELYQRDDDKAETVRNRIQVYQTLTQPLIDFYNRQGLLMEVDGSQPIEMVSQDLMAALARVK